LLSGALQQRLVSRITTVRLNGSLGFCKRAMERVFGGEGAVSI
jgi:hypothetical protein